MSDTSTHDNDLSFDDDPDGPEDHRIGMKRADIRALEAAAKKGKDAEANAAAAEEAKRELAFTKAGIDTDSAEGKLFMRGYDGELDKEAVRTAAIPFGLVSAEDAPAKSGGHVLHDDSGDTALQPGEADMTAQRNTVAGNAPPDKGIELDPYTSALELGQRVIKEGGKFEEGFAAGFASLVAAANDGDARVIIDRRSPAGAGEG